ncbi:MAG: histidine--tRNA ligase [Solirubrobacterales bacterium]
MSNRFQAPRGTFDILPELEEARTRIERIAREVLGSAGYGRIETPVLEDTSLFQRGVGESTDIVRKEMFSLTDQGDRSLTLRPEGTAAICRAYVEHGMHRLPQPVKVWYQGPFFRQERPQAGRYRQFTQIGAEAIGSDSPLVDAELIIGLSDLLGRLEVPGVLLRLSSLGSPDSRAAYRAELTAYLSDHADELHPDVRDRIATNPLRAFDAADEGTRRVMADAPRMVDRLSIDDSEHFAEVRHLLDAEGIAYELDGTLVRGLDYYTRTVFEFTCDALGAQSGIAGGGRYDRLVAELGGPETPAAGWAAGIERILLALGDQQAVPPRDVYVVAGDDAARAKAFALALELRRHGMRAECDLAGRSVKGQFKQADRLGARQAVVLENGGSATVRDMAAGTQREVPIARLVTELRGL